MGGKLSVFTELHFPKYYSCQIVFFRMSVRGKYQVRTIKVEIGWLCCLDPTEFLLNVTGIFFREKHEDDRQPHQPFFPLTSASAFQQLLTNKKASKINKVLKMA